MFDILIIVLAAYRLTVMLVDEAGPFQAFGRIRHWTRNNWIGEGLACYACTSVWVAALVMGVYRYTDLFITLELLALSQVVVWVTEAANTFDVLVYSPKTTTEDHKDTWRDIPVGDAFARATTFFDHKGKG